MYKTVIVQEIIDIDLEESGSSITLKVLTDDDKIYHVKLPHGTRNNNLHEYLAHIIANHIKAPIPGGCFLNFDRDHYIELQKAIEKQITFIEETKKFRPNSLDKYLMFLKQILNETTQNEFRLFGLVFIEGAKEDLTKEEFNILIKEKKIKNISDFYSLYAFDFYLDNGDRHIKNILILDGLNIAYLIDHDKIFSQKNIDIGGVNNIDKTLFRCVKNTSNKYLYDIIETRGQYEQIVAYAYKISSISEETIKAELQKNYYNLSSEQEELIANYLIYRKKRIVSECKKFKEKCYENIS